LNVILLVRKSCELTATALVATFFVEGSSNKGLSLVWAISLMVAISYVVVGVGPRTLGKQNAVKWARPAITIAVLMSKLLGPLTTLLIGIGNALTPGKGFKSGPFSTEAEFRDLVDQARESGFVEESEREMIHSVFDLGETLVRELMVPRTEMVWIEADKTVRQGLSLALRSGFTRIPVISENLDNVVGIAYVKDLAKRVHDNPNSEVNEKVEDHLRKATFVPENQTADELLKQMQRDQIHMAIVVDEYGGTAGIITIEDILEEIVGEIADEYDDNEIEEVEWLDEKKARISVRLHVEDFAEQFESVFTDEEIEDVDSIGGLIAKHLGRVPIPGSTITVPGWKLTAERPTGRRHRIATVLVEKIEESGKLTDQL
jgi:CBS domain containing-hemolysin-like protein